MATPCVVVQLPVERHKVHEIKRWKYKIFPKTVYTGNNTHLPRPPNRQDHIEKQWDGAKRNMAEGMTNMENEIAEMNQAEGINFTSDMLEQELVLTGRKVHSRIALLPHVWIRYPHSWMEDIVRKEVRTWRFLGHYGFGDEVHIDNNGPRWVTNATTRLPRPITLGRGIDLPNGYSLHINVQERSAMSSACGLMLSIALTQNGTIKYHGVSRLGGVLEIKEPSGKRYNVAVTAAHSLLEHFLARTKSAANNTASKSAKKYNNEYRGWLPRNMRLETRKLESGVGAVAMRQRDTEFGEVQQDELDALQWKSIKDGTFAINWLGGGWELAGDLKYPFMVADPKRISLDADFALFRLPMNLDNKYEALAGYHNTRSKFELEVTGWMKEDELSSQKVHVLLGANRTAEATILAEKPSLYLRGRPFPTRKIHLEKPLAVGTSGCWVVQGHRLCGLIVASYAIAPFAHMITAEKLFTDIKKTIGLDFEVSLPVAFASSHNPLPLNLAPNEEKRTLVLEHSESGSDFIVPVLDYGMRLRRINAYMDASTDQLLHDIRIVRERCISEPASLKSLLNEFLTRQLVVPPTDSTKYYLPLDVLELTFDRELVGLFVGDDDIRREALCNYVCGPQGKRGHSIRIATKILAILILIERSGHIFSFMENNVHDGHLPLARHDQKGAHFSLRGADSFFLSTNFEDWSIKDIRHFDEFQWSMLSPFFSKSSSGKALFYRLHSRVILPWVEYKEVAEGGFSTMNRAKIHPAHHDFPSARNGDVAVKALLSSNRDLFDIEIRALQQLPSHDHLVGLLASYQTRDSYYMIFPWAFGGNLYDLWKSSLVRPPPSKSLLSWMVWQCLGIAEALEAIHESFKTGDDPISATKLPVYGRHGDIKPENILWFPDRGTIDDVVWESEKPLTGSLRISDFGLTQFHERHTHSRQPAHPLGGSPTYRAPEADTESVVSRRYDIWSLGCVYLEFLTWLLLGWNGLDEFSMLRLRERSAGMSWSEDSFFSVKKSKAVVKTAVTKWCEELREHSQFSSEMFAFLRLVEEDMLVIQVDRRISATYLCAKLFEICCNIDDSPLKSREKGRLKTESKSAREPIGPHDDMPLDIDLNSAHSKQISQSKPSSVIGATTETIPTSSSQPEVSVGRETASKEGISFKMNSPRTSEIFQVTESLKSSLPLETGAAIQTDVPVKSEISPLVDTELPVQTGVGQKDDYNGGEESDPLFACPFAKFNPEVYSSCVGRFRMRRFVDVKQHVMRTHTIGAQNARSTPGAYFLTKHQVEQLQRGDRGSRMNAADKWYNLYYQIFPHGPQLDSPYLQNFISEARGPLRDRFIAALYIPQNVEALRRVAPMVDGIGLGNLLYHFLTLIRNAPAPSQEVLSRLRAASSDRDALQEALSFSQPRDRLAVEDSSLQPSLLADETGHEARRHATVSESAAEEIMLPAIEAQTVQDYVRRMEPDSSQTGHERRTRERQRSRHSVALRRSRHTFGRSVLFEVQRGRPLEADVSLSTKTLRQMSMPELLNLQGRILTQATAIAKIVRDRQDVGQQEEEKPTAPAHAHARTGRITEA